jgi:PhnB protein
MAVNYRPEGYADVTASFMVDGADAVVDFATQVLGAKERFNMRTPDGKIGHAELEIGDSVIFVSEASTSDQGRHMPAVVNVYVQDVDATYQKALAAGGESLREPETMFYGDRSAGVRDKAGNQWWLATHVEDVPPEEMDRRMKEWETQHQG